MHAATIADLARTRSAFETWRASQSGHRRRIPEHLWQMALALLDQYSVSRVCRELGLNCHRLRFKLSNSANSANPAPQPVAHFLPVRVADFDPGDRTIFSADAESRYQARASLLANDLRTQ